MSSKSNADALAAKRIKEAAQSRDPVLQLVNRLGISDPPESIRQLQFTTIFIPLPRGGNDLSKFPLFRLVIVLQGEPHTIWFCRWKEAFVGQGDLGFNSLCIC
jgi:hypothetical protein